MNIQLDKGFIKKLSGKIEGYNFMVGTLQDETHYHNVEGSGPNQKFKKYAGGPIRETSPVASDLSDGDVLVKNMERLKINLLLRPFEEETSEIMRFTRAFLNMAMAKGQRKRVENLLQAIVRNPILRLEYGKNSEVWAEEKGFNRHLFDTGQMFRAIKAKVIRV